MKKQISIRGQLNIKEKIRGQETLAIVIANYNGASDIELCLDSLTKSSFNDFFVVIVDDCSERNVADSIFINNCQDKYPFRIEGVKTDKNLGFAGANNMGIKTALRYAPSYIMLLNNDTVILEDAIEILVSRLNNSSKTIASPKILYMDDDTKIWSAGGEFDDELKIPKNRGASEADTKKFDIEQECFYLSFCAVMMPAKIFEEIGMLSEDYYMYSEDVDYCIRLRKQGYKLLYLPEAVIKHKGGASQVSSGSDSLYYSVRNECILREKYMDGGVTFNEKLLAKNKQKVIVKKMAHMDYSRNEKMVEAIEAWKRGERGKRV